MSVSTSQDIGTLYPDVSEVECPFPTFRELRHDAPVRQVPDRPHYLVTRYEDIEYVLRHHELFSNVRSYSSVSSVANLGEAEVPASLIETDPPDHRARRRRVTSRSHPSACAPTPRRSGRSRLSW